MSSTKRISKEYADCSQNPPNGMSLALPSEGDLHTWHVTLEGPPESPYAGGRFGLVVVLPAEYPFKPPTVHFATRIYHPNVTNDSTGNICLAILKADQWKPALKMRAVLDAVCELLVEPQPDDPLEARIADEYRTSRAAFNTTAAAYVAKYAKGMPMFKGPAATTAAAAATAAQ